MATFNTVKAWLLDAIGKVFDVIKPEIESKANASDLASVATSGSYTDLTNKPAIPTVPINVSAFTNDAGYLTSHQSLDAYTPTEDLAAVALSNSYNDLSNKPTIPTVPTNVSAFNNDAGYLTQHQSLSAYTPTNDLAAVALSNSYNSLDDKPTIPTVPAISMNISQDAASEDKTAAPKAVISYVTGLGYQTAGDVASAISGKQDALTFDNSPTPNSNNPVKSGGIYTAIDNVVQVAQGKTACYVFDTVSQLDTWLSDPAHTALLNTGDVFLIRAVDVPDYWWDGTSTPPSKQVLETTKVDLSHYVQDSDLATVATSGSYTDLSNKPSIPTVPTNVSAFLNDAGYLTQHQSLNEYTKTRDLAAVATSGSYADLSNKPSLATVATSGSYSDLSNKPSLATVATSGSYSDLSNKPNLATVATSGSYNDLSNTPSNPLTLSSKSGYNCDTLYDGKVWLIGSGSNCPGGSQYGALFTMPYRQASGNTKPDFGAQIFLPNGDDSTKPNSMFYRTSLANTWNGWKEVAVEGSCAADTVDGYHIVVSSSAPASGTSNSIITIVV